MTTPTHRQGLSLLIVTSVAALSLFGSIVSASAQQKPVELNVILPLTGGASFVGKLGQQGLIFEEEIINAAGGIKGRPVKFVFHDDQTSPQVAVQHANRIISSGANVILGSSISSMCNAVAPLVKSGPLMYCFSPGIHPGDGSFVFSAHVSTKDLSALLIRFFREKGWTRLAVLTSSDATGQDAERGILEAVKLPENAGVTILDMSRFNPTDTSVSAKIERIREVNPQAIIVWTTGAPLGTVLKGIRQAGLKLPVGTTSGNLSYPIMDQLAAVLPEELYLLSGTGSAEMPDDLLPKGVADARKTFRDVFAKANLKADNSAEVVWDATAIVVNALRKLGADAKPEELRREISSLSGFAGATGVYDFRAVPQRGLNASNAVVVRYDVERKSFVAVTKPGGDLQ